MDNQKDNQKPQSTMPQQAVSSTSNTPAASINIFSATGVSDEHFVFQAKKTEKILSALYLVTNFIPQNEPVRAQVRDLGLQLLTHVVSLNSAASTEKDIIRTSISTLILHITSLLEVSYFAGFISEMNYAVIKKELLNLSESIVKSARTKDSYFLPQSFFAQKDVAAATLPPRPMFEPTVDNVPDANMAPIIKDKKIDTPVKVITQGQVTSKQSGAVAVKKNSRQGTILDILKKKKEIMIKDVSAVIADCSEKTLQRELLAMVEQGILKKEGERRWSRYSLAMAA